MRIKKTVFSLIISASVLTLFSAAAVPVLADTGAAAASASKNSTSSAAATEKSAAGTSSTSKTIAAAKPAPLRITAVQVNTDAAKNLPGTFKVKFSGSWSAAAVPAKLKKQGYALKYSLQDSTGKVLKNGINLKGITYVVKNDKKKYRIVCTATKKGKKTLTYKSAVTGTFNFVPVPKTVTATCPKSNYNVTVKWSKVTGAAGYMIYRSKVKKRPAKPVKTVSGGGIVKFVDKKMAAGTYYYWVRTIYKGTNTSKVYRTASVASTARKVSVRKYLRIPIQKIKWRAKAKKTGALYKSKKGSSKKGSIKKGTALIVTKKYPKWIEKQTAKPKRVYVIQYNGKKIVKQGWVKWGVVKKVKGKTSWDKKLKRTLDWPTSVKEAYVKNRASKTKYLIWTSTYTQKINIFKGKKGNWKLVKCFNTCTGVFIHPTAMGMNQRIKKHQYKKIRTSPRGNKYYFTHLSFFSRHAFHTISWRLGTHRVIKGMNTHGQPNTLGSVRLSVKNATWIYHHIPNNTKVMTH